MDDADMDRIIGNEKEWRKYLVRKVENIETEQTKIKEQMSAMKVWIWIGRAAFVAAFGGIITWVKSSLQ